MHRNLTQLLNLCSKDDKNMLQTRLNWITNFPSHESPEEILELLEQTIQRNIAKHINNTSGSSELMLTDGTQDC
jgi:hypothetical protein